MYPPALKKDPGTKEMPSLAAPPTATTPPSQCYLLDKIPPEIRLFIYESLWGQDELEISMNVLTDSLEHCLIERTNARRLPSLSILAACKQTYQEAHPVYYHRALFAFKLEALGAEDCLIEGAHRIKNCGAFKHMRDMYLYVELDVFAIPDEDDTLDLPTIALLVEEISGAPKLEKLELHMRLCGAKVADVEQVTQFLGDIRCRASVECSICHSYMPEAPEWAAVECYYRMVAAIGG